MAPEPQAGSVDPSRPVHIVFVGAGAVGCFYASRLHHPSHNIHVSLIARSNYAPLAKEGVHLETRSFGNYTFRPHAVFPSVAAAAAAATAPDPNPLNAAAPAGASPSSSPPPGGWDFIVVTTKALPDRGDDAATIAPLVGPRSAIVLIQNGVGVEHPYRRLFPRTPIVSAVTVISAEQIRPGTVRQNRWTRVHLGPYTDSASLDEGGGEEEEGAADDNGSSKPSSSSAGEEARRALERRGTEATAQLCTWLSALGAVPDAEALTELGLQTVRWHKLCINAAFNPSAVLSGGRGNADMLLSSPELRAHLRGVMDEVWRAAPAVLGGRSFEDAGHAFATPERIVASTERNRGARPSMLLDWEAGRPLELEVILGNPVRIARRNGVEMPRLQAMYALLKSAQDMRDREKEKEQERGKTKGKL